MVRRILKESDYTDLDDAISVLEELLDKYSTGDDEYSLRMRRIPSEKIKKTIKDGYAYAARETGIDVDTEENYAIRAINDLIDRVENINKYWESYYSYIKQVTQG